MTQPFVELTVSGSFQQATMVILPLAAIAGGIRNIRIHFADQVLILMERIDVAIGAALCFIYIRQKFDFPLPWADTGRVFLATAIMLIVLILVPWDKLRIGPAVHIALESGLGVLLYGIALVWLNPEYARIGLRQLVAPAAEER